MPEGQIYHVAVCPFVDTDSTPVVLEMGIDVTQRMQAERQIARISEQQKRSIGQDLHDSVGQKLAGLRFLLQALVQRVGEDLPEQAPLAGKAQEVLQDALAQVRALARSLDPLGLEGDEICDLLDQLARDTCKLFDVECEVDCPKGLILNSSQELQLYRIAQEAVGNALRRRHARKISITVTSGKDGIILTVQDDGIGIDDRGRKQEMFALQTMRHRVSGLGGTIRFESHDSKATVLRCRLPYPSGHSGEEDGFNW
jgi:signal transduction histidine kinase